jgi:hypothetical protein
MMRRFSFRFPPSSHALVHSRTIPPTHHRKREQKNDESLAGQERALPATFGIGNTVIAGKARSCRRMPGYAAARIFI